MKSYEETQTVWERLAAETRPIALYGMGDGADKILRVFEQYGIRASAVFASDEFARGNLFHGFRVGTLDEVTAQFGEDIVIVISFASQRSEVLARLYALEARYDVVAPDVPVAGGALFDRAFVRQHADALRRAYALLADAQSRLVFERTVRYKLTGSVACLRACESGKEEVFGALLRPAPDEHFVDLGAYNGDTIRELLGYTDGRFASVTAFEPDRKNCKKLQKYIDDTLDGRARIVPAGAWSCDDTLHFAQKAGRNSAVSGAGEPVEVRAVDSVLAGDPCTLLKLDVEGAERHALLGARATIARWRPKLNVAAYHRSEDLFALPLLVHELCPQYRIFLRHHPYVPAWDTNLYAVSP